MPWGGFLCEEMGLGKTIEVLALTLAAPPGPGVVSSRLLPSGKIESRATLVVGGRQRRLAGGQGRLWEGAGLEHRFFAPGLLILAVHPAGTSSGAIAPPRPPTNPRRPFATSPPQVCAVSLVGQWCAEAQAKLQGRALRMHQ
jgi:hypothetical protein